MSVERTLVLCKPDAVQRGLVGKIVARLEQKGLKLVGLKLAMLPETLAKEHYREHRSKSYFDELIAYIISSPVIVVAVEGEHAVEVVRALMGATNPQKAAPGTIRGDFGLDLTMNLVHGSDSLGSAERELGIFFAPSELYAYPLTLERWT
jgi:nucleoside-diphosphate kinase